MALEIERKFLVKNNDWQKAARSAVEMRQGYLAKDACTVRVRIAGESGFLTLKTKGNGITRDEFEYGIPVSDAEQLLGLCKNIITKTRSLVPLGDHTWEIDVFTGENEGLIIAEIELKEENESFQKPEWLGEEVTQDKRYSNSNLSTKPWTSWKEK
jgi:adenylate cyclase